MSDKKHIINEGVVKADAFSFDFNHDGRDSIINLTCDIHSSTIFGNVYYFQYEFNPNVPSSVRSEFIHALKFDQASLGEENVDKFIEQAVFNLQREVDLTDIGVVIYPYSSSNVTGKIVEHTFHYIYGAEYMCVEAAKKATDEIRFDLRKFNSYCNIHHVDEKSRKIMMDKIDRMIETIRSKSYFSIAKDIRDPKYRTFIEPVYEFTDEESRSMLRTIEGERVLIIDDVVTSGATVDQLIHAFRTLNNDKTNDIIVFSLIGK